MSAIYLDGHATTPISPEALEAMVRQAGQTGNPHAAHAAGAAAADAVEKGRAEIAALIGANPGELVFTSGATEANNLAIVGFARAARKAGSARRTIITSTIEHPSVIGAAKLLEGEGFRHVAVGVDSNGVVARDAYIAALGDALLVSIGLANGEIGTVQPFRWLADRARQAGAIIHSDATQAAGRIPVDVLALDVDALSVSSHKLYGPTGVGALYVSSAAPIRPEPLFAGGGQEQGLRPGTVPAMLVAGFGAAAAAQDLGTDAEHAENLRSIFLAALAARGTDYVINVEPVCRLPGSLNLRFPGVEGDSLIDQLAGVVDIATGSACSSGKIEPSQVLMEVGLDYEDARASIRLYFHRYLSEAAVRVAADAIADAAARFHLVAGEVIQ